VTIACRLAGDARAGGAWDDCYYGDEDEDDEDFADALLDLLARIRSCLMRAECEPLYAVWEEYGCEEEGAADGAPPRPEETASGRVVAAELAAMLESA